MFYQETARIRNAFAAFLFQEEKTEENWENIDTTRGKKKTRKSGNLTTKLSSEKTALA